jgi:hypothetical protein
VSIHALKLVRAGRHDFQIPAQFAAMRETGERVLFADRVTATSDSVGDFVGGRMSKAGWRRRVAPMIWFVMIACSTESPSKEETSGEQVEADEDAGSREPGVDGGGATQDAAAPNTVPAGSDAGASQGGGGAQEAFFRLDKFVLKEPSLVLRVLGLETPIASDVQSMLDTSLTDDTEPADGSIDLNVLLRFSGTSDPATTAGKLTFGGALCPHPADAVKPCRSNPTAPFFEPAVSFSNASKCALEGDAQSVSGACFQSSKGRMAVSLPLFGPVVLDDAEVIASWAGGGITEGWIRGFVTEQTAMATKIQGEVPSHLALFDVQKGSSLTTFLPQAERVSGASGAGWPFLAQFTAKTALFEAGR